MFMFRIIGYFDMDAGSAPGKQRENLNLRGQPVIVTYRRSHAA